MRWSNKLDAFLAQDFVIIQKVTLLSQKRNHLQTNKSRRDFSLPCFLQSSSSAIKSLVPGYDWLIKLNHQCCAFVPVGSDLGREAAVCEDGLHDACSKSSAVQAAVLFGHRDVRVDKWLLFYDVVSLVIIIGLLQLVSLLPKQGLPHIDLKQFVGAVLVQVKSWVCCRRNFF